MNAIVSVTGDWGIGSEGRLLVRNKADMHRFVELTMGGTVLMGRKTFESFPGGALKGRRNVVLTRDGGFRATGVEVVHDVDQALRAVSEGAGEKGEKVEKVWLIGGESVYRELLPACELAYVTKNDVVLPADAFFPDYSGWHETWREHHDKDERHAQAYDFVDYEPGKRAEEQ